MQKWRESQTLVKSYSDRIFCRCTGRDPTELYSKKTCPKMTNTNQGILGLLFKRTTPMGFLRALDDIEIDNIDFGNNWQ
jgi:hypothetical protein